MKERRGWRQEEFTVRVYRIIHAIQENAGMNFGGNRGEICTKAKNIYNQKYFLLTDFDKSAIIIKMPYF